MAQPPIQPVLLLYLLITAQEFPFIRKKLHTHTHASLVAQTVKRLPTMLETRVCSLGRVDPLEKEMATHSSTLAWEMLWSEEPGAGYCP